MHWHAALHRMLCPFDLAWPHHLQRSDAGFLRCGAEDPEIPPDLRQPPPRRARAAAARSAASRHKAICRAVIAAVMLKLMRDTRRHAVAERFHCCRCIVPSRDRPECWRVRNCYSYRRQRGRWVSSATSSAPSASSRNQHKTTASMYRTSEPMPRQKRRPTSVPHGPR